MKTRMVQLGEVARIGAGQSAPQDPAAFSRDGNAFIRAASLEPLCNTGSLTSLERVIGSTAAKYRLHLYPENTLVFAKSGMSATKNRIYRLRESCYVVNHLATVEPSTELDPTFLRYWLEHFDPTTLIQDAAYPSISQEDIGAVVLPLPSLPEQRRIAGMLEQADRLRRTRRYALELSDTFLPAAFLEMFRDPARKTRWPSVPFGDLIATGPQNGLYKPSSAYGTGTPIVRIDAYQSGEAIRLGDLKRVRLTQDEIRLYALSHGDFLINRVNSRSHLGKSTVVPRLPEPMVFESNMMRFRVAESVVDPTYVLHFLQTPYLNAQIQKQAKDASNQSSINQTDVLDFAFLLPPLPLQQRFADLVRGHERLRAAQRESLRQAEHLFQSLLHRAFSEAA